MPKGPKGEKRPADVIGTAIKVARIATGEVEDDTGDDGARTKPSPFYTSTRVGLGRRISNAGRR